MPDFGFVGPSYEAPSIYQEAQECINFYPEIDPLKQAGQRGVVALYPTPGLTQLIQPEVGPVRAMRNLSGNTILLVVINSSVYSISTSYVAIKVGTLGTSAGFVSMTDNITTANGLTAYIVDRVNRYTWVASTNTFTTLPVTDGPWQGASVVDVVDNYYIYNNVGTQNWACTDLGSALSTNAYYGTKDAAPDPLIAIIADHRQVFLLGQQTTEVWTDVGNQIAGIISFPFARIQGTMVQHGLAAVGSVARFSEMFMFVSKDSRGQAIIGAIQGYAFVRLSTHAVEQTLLGQTISDAVAYTYQLEGHEFYVVTFPSVNLTWVYDLTTQMWHKWLAWDGSQYNRHRSNCGAFFNNSYLVGDYQNGNIYALDNAVYTDNGATIRRLRRAPHLVTDLQREYFAELQIQFQPGVGLQTGQGQDPQAMLRWSNDGGSTYSNEHWTSIGMVGKYKNRAIWRRLGQARDRIFEVSISDPVKAVIVSANLKAEIGEN